MRHSMRYTSHSKRQYAPFSLNKIKHLFFFMSKKGAYWLGHGPSVGMGLSVGLGQGLGLA